MGSPTNASDEGEEFSEITGINITPFVDVVLVLLVIFIITAPGLMKEALTVQLPKAVTGDSKQFDQMGVSVTKQGQILLNGELTSNEELFKAVQAMVAKNPSAQILIAADTESIHGDVVKAIDIVKSAGAVQFAFQIQKP